MRSFVKIKSSRFCAITLSFTDTGETCPIREFLTPQICLLSLFARIKFSKQFPNLQYLDPERPLLLSEAVVLLFISLFLDVPNGFCLSGKGLITF